LCSFQLKSRFQVHPVASCIPFPLLFSYWSRLLRDEPSSSFLPQCGSELQPVALTEIHRSRLSWVSLLFLALFLSVLPFVSAINFDLLLFQIAPIIRPLELARAANLAVWTHKPSFSPRLSPQGRCVTGDSLCFFFPIYTFFCHC